MRYHGYLEVGTQGWSESFFLDRTPQLATQNFLASDTHPAAQRLSPGLPAIAKGFTWRQIRAGIHWRLSSYLAFSIRIPHAPPGTLWYKGMLCVHRLSSHLVEEPTRIPKD
jgi:hypothetical protein